MFFLAFAARGLEHDFQIIQRLPEIIKDSGEKGKFELGNLFITIKEINEYQNVLINPKN